MPYDERDIRALLALAVSLDDYANPAWAEVEAVAADFYLRMIESGLTVTRIKPPGRGKNAADI